MLILLGCGCVSALVMRVAVLLPAEVTSREAGRKVVMANVRARATRVVHKGGWGLDWIQQDWKGRHTRDAEGVEKDQGSANEGLEVLERAQ